MRIEESFGFIPQGIFFLTAVSGNLFDRRGSVDTFTVDEDWLHHFADGIGSGFHLCLFPCLAWIKEEKIFLRIDFFVYKSDIISFHLAGFFFVNTVNRLVARIGDLFCVLRKFDFRFELTILILDGSELIYTTE